MMSFAKTKSMAAVCGFLIFWGTTYLPAKEVSLASDNLSSARVMTTRLSDDTRVSGDATPAEITAEPISLAGNWSGGWYSCSTSHKGPLFAQFCPLSNGDYQVNFRGRFFRIFPFRYSVVLRVVEEHEGTVVLRGQSYLGRLFGTFYYEATASECEFRADYHSCQDRGTFWLKRCCP